MGVTFDGAAAIKWISDFCRIPKGPAVGAPMVLLPYQCEVLHAIFDSPTRRVIVSMGRQNGKTSFAACLTLLHLAGPRHQRNGLLVSSALTRDQAALLFDAAAKMVRFSPELSAAVDVIEHQKTLRCRELGTVYRALSADAPTQLGLSPYFVVHDELGAVRGPFSDLYNVLESGGAAQANPLSLIISTQAAANTDLLSQLIDDAAAGADPRVKVFLYAAPADADPFVEATWRLANPALGHFLNVDEIKAQAETARRMPSAENSFRNLILNQRIETAAQFVSPTVWAENGAPPTPLVRGATLDSGADLAAVHDLTAVTFVGVDGSVYPFCWLPEEGLAEKSRADDVDYVNMAKDGTLLTTPGRAVNYDFVARFLRKMFDEYDIRSFAFDRAYMRFLRPCLERAGFTEAELAKFVEVGQGFLGMSPCIRELEVRLLEKRLKHGNHPLLSMAATNAAVVLDDLGNRKFTKRKSTGRIDPLVALAMAVSVIPPAAPDEPEYNVFFVGGPPDSERGWHRLN